MKISKADKQRHFKTLGKIFKQVIAKGDSYVHNPKTDIGRLSEYWFPENGSTFVIEDSEGLVLGAYIIKPNRIDLGDHIANCSYMVAPEHQGKGIGKLLCAHSLHFAKQLGFSGVQFNFVVSTNKPAIHLWKKFGFEIIGTIPKAFRHQQKGRVDVHIMFKKL